MHTLVNSRYVTEHAVKAVSQVRTAVLFFLEHELFAGCLLVSSSDAQVQSCCYS
jgi:hypothetical protein